VLYIFNSLSQSLRYWQLPLIKLSFSGEHWKDSQKAITTGKMEYTRYATWCLLHSYIALWTSDACHRLGKSGLKISKVILGAMSYGSSDWQEWVLNEEESLPLLEHAYKVGLNTWDTARRLTTEHRVCRAKRWRDNIGRCLLQRPLGRDNRQSSPEILHPPRERRAALEMLLRRRPVRCAAPGRRRLQKRRGVA